MPAIDPCHLFLDPEHAPPAPGFYLRVWPRPPEYRHVRTVWDVMGFLDADVVVDAVFAGLPWAYADLPADPRACVPGLVEEVARARQLGLDPAALYLQLLALAAPSERNVRWWNGWTPARHKKAVAELVERGLVGADKRPAPAAASSCPAVGARGEAAAADGGLEGAAAGSRNHTAVGEANLIKTRHRVARLLHRITQRDRSGAAWTSASSSPSATTAGSFRRVLRSTCRPSS